MNDIQLFNQELVSKRIPLEVLVVHILFRNEVTKAGLIDFDLVTVEKWFNDISWDQHYKGQEPFMTPEGVTEVACITLANTLKNDDLRRLVQFDILNLFGGVQNSLQMVHQSFNLPSEITEVGAFGNIPFEPKGMEPKYFPNGSRAVSSKYLEAVSLELKNQGMLGNKNPRNHRDILKKIREYMANISHGENFRRENMHSYYDLIEGTYKSSRGRNETHIWMSKDLCLAIAATEHQVIQMRVIDDLNRLQSLVTMYAGHQLPQPSLQTYLPGTLEEQYRENGLTEISTGRSLGYYPMAQVKQMFCDQQGVDQAAFDVKYPWNGVYTDLYNLTVHLNQRTLDTESHTGKGVTKLFHISVLKEYFKEIDFSSLEL